MEGARGGRTVCTRASVIMLVLYALDATTALTDNRQAKSEWHVFLQVSAPEHEAEEIHIQSCRLCPCRHCNQQNPVTTPPSHGDGAPKWDEGERDMGSM